MTLRIGLLGASRIAPKAVIAHARGRADVAITAVAARDLGRARAYAAEHAIPAAVEGYAALLARDDVDAVYSALPPAEHLDWTRAAAAPSPAPTKRLTCGRIAVPSAAPMTPSGSWLRRSA